MQDSVNKLHQKEHAGQQELGGKQYSYAGPLATGVAGSSGILFSFWMVR